MESLKSSYNGIILGDFLQKMFYWERLRMDIDRYDLRILTELQRDGRLSVVELAEAIGLSPTPCARRIKALESSGAIEGYAAVLNPRRNGGAVREGDRPAR
jgi:DNA-binding Lrp family transcriptional regulator